MVTKRLLSLPLISLSTRTYHSTSHPSPPSPSPFPPLSTAILTSSTPHIPTHSFTLASLSLGAQDLGYVDASKNLFPKGAFSLVEWHLFCQREKLKNWKGFNEGIEGRKLGVGEKVKLLTWERLMGNRDVIGKLQDALALSALPPNILTSLSALNSLSDEIWYLAGDTAVDTSYYTKRASLCAIYASTELFMTNDKSEGFKDTREFMERRFRDSKVLGGVVGGIGEWVMFNAHAGLNVLRSKGVRI